MNTEKRREILMKRLREAKQPLTGTKLARELGVSRQIIVGDIALLRAGGAEISATPRGYVLPRATDGITRTIACRHTLEQTGTELDILVDNGCTVLDVIVEHPVYGQLTGQLQISSRYDVEQFLARVQAHDAAPLSMLTGGRRYVFSPAALGTALLPSSLVSTATLLLSTSMGLRSSISWPRTSVSPASEAAGAAGPGSTSWAVGTVSPTTVSCI